MAAPRKNVPALRGGKKTVVKAPRPKHAPKKPRGAYRTAPLTTLDAAWERAVKNVAGCMILNMMREATHRGSCGPRVSLVRFETQLRVRAHGLAKHFKRAYPGAHDKGCRCREEMLLASIAHRTAEKTSRWTEDELFTELTRQFDQYTAQLSAAVN